MVEAKAEHKDVLAVMDYQGVEYPSSVRPEDLKYTAGAWGENGKYKVPFMFATNGRPYIKQFETKSGIWFRDLRDESNAPKALHGWMSPDGLYDMLGEDTEKANKALACTPYSELTNPDGLGLRYYQLEAVQATEKAIAEGKREVLLAMATGTGKTRTVLGIIYRFLKSGRFRRIPFLVDRNELGDQAGKTFHEVPLEDVLSLDKLYNITGLNDGGKVDLLSTSVDVLSITNIVFLRFVKSRILYEQMIGRATRKCDAIKNPENIVVIFDTYTYSYRKEEIVNRCKWLLIEEIRTGDVYHDGWIYYRKSDKESYNIRHGKIYRKLKQSAMENRNN